MGGKAGGLDLSYASDLRFIQSMYEDDSFWECILDAELAYLNHGIDPHGARCVRPEIADSWMLASQQGLDPSRTDIGEQVSDEFYEMSARQNSRLIDTAAPLLSSIESLNVKNDYIFELMGAGGLSYLQIGDLKLHRFVGARYLVDESNVGTNAHTLCMKHKRPFVVIGPEHYCFALQELIACAAPIVDQYDTAIGALLLTQPISERPPSPSERKLLIHAMSLLSTLATTISAQLKLRSYDRPPVAGRAKQPAHRSARSPEGADAGRPVIGASRKGRNSGATTTFDDILGRSCQVEKAKKLAARFARTGESILITGESGTGKELFAQAVHTLSRPGGPFVAINCAAIPPHLIESELFGYEPGSFTGAEKKGKPGKIELADGGTLFLDEIGDMPLELQATLLRVLEDKRVIRIGGSTHKRVDFRLITATNQDLGALMAKGLFREDLLYRLSVLTIQLPPLRNRTGDPLFFARLFLEECREESGGGAAALSPEAERFIEAYRWPGNVRQLRHAVYSAYYTSEDDVIELDDFPAYIVQDLDITPGSAPPIGPSSDVKVPAGGSNGGRPRIQLPTLSLEELERLAIEQALDEANGSIAEAASMLGISKATLYRRTRAFHG